LSSALDHVLWVGGAQGAGKSAAARAFAHRKGLRLYFVDAFTYSHAERAETGLYPAMRFDAYEEAGDALEQRLVAPESEIAPETVRELRRDENQMVVDQIKRYLASDEGPAEPAKLFPLSCECTRLRVRRSCRDRALGVRARRAGRRLPVRPLSPSAVAASSTTLGGCRS
jgi:hypothetical protein